MKAKGWQMGRGGFWCNIGEFETIKKLHAEGYFLNTEIKDISLRKSSHFVYIMELQHNKYYVGYTRSLQSAIRNHEKGSASVWTKTNKPIRFLKIQEVIFEDGIPI